MTDRRSKTSRANLGEHIPEALSPRGTVVVPVRMPIELAERLDKARGERTRSEYIREALEATMRTPERQERNRAEFFSNRAAFGAGPEDTEVESPLMGTKTRRHKP